MFKGAKRGVIQLCKVLLKKIKQRIKLFKRDASQGKSNKPC